MAVAVVLVFVVYPLSYGPFSYLEGKFGVRSLAVRTTRWVYTPIHIVLHVCPDSLDGPYREYLHWWFELGRVPL